jgi:hypothetical protein
VRNWLARAVVIGVALFVFVLAVVGVFEASITAILVVLTVILVNNALRLKGGMKR